MSKLFEPFTMGGRRLANRIAMAPLTRSRARVGNVPSELAPLYYSQRAAAGLIVSESPPRLAVLRLIEPITPIIRPVQLCLRPSIRLPPAQSSISTPATKKASL
jgi:hypothetical protein